MCLSLVSTYFKLLPSRSWYQWKTELAQYRIATRGTSPVLLVSQYYAGVWLRAIKMEIRATQWAHVA